MRNKAFRKVVAMIRVALLSLLIMAGCVHGWQPLRAAALQRLCQRLYMSSKRGISDRSSSRKRNSNTIEGMAQGPRGDREAAVPRAGRLVQPRLKPVREEERESSPAVYVEHPHVKSHVTLLPGKARLFQDGNPLIFGGAVKEVFGQPLSGAEVIVKDHRGNDVGRGFYNPDNIITKRINDAIIHRKTISLPSAATSIYRLVNGEGDRLGGLMIDVIGNIVVIQASAVWVEVNKPDVVKSVIDILIQRENYSIRKIIWRRVDTRLKQDGYVGDTQDEVVYHKTPDDLTMKKEIVVENGIKYAVFPDDGQKTGFYCDQRDNRQTLKSLSLNKSVLDMYCYTGGFALNAALGGAKEVIAIDSSQLAIDTCLENAALNQVSHVIKGYKIDAIGFMQQMIQEGKSYDIVIADPPKLAPTRTSLANAKSKYIKINTLAMSLVKPGGLLLTCSCSAAVTQSGEFTNIISEAARIARKDIKILSTTSAALDHPVHLHYQEGKYLTAAFLVVA